MSQLTAGTVHQPDLRKRKTGFVAYLKKYWFLYMLVLPGFLFMAVFDYGPMYGSQLAFKKYSPKLGVWGSQWIGLANFDRMVADPAQPDRLDPAFLYENDWLHLNASGYEKMGWGIDRNLFR